MTPARVVVLAIDAASPTLLERWAADGSLPNVRALLSRGLVGRTRNLDGFCVGSTWPSWYTGATPARHGLHYLVQLRPGTYDLYRPADEGLVRQEAFWSRLSRAGGRVAVLDVPVSALDDSLNGVQVVEWGGHDAVFGLRSHPADLAPRIVSSFGAHPLATSCDDIGRTAGDYRTFASQLEAGVRAKTEWTLDLLGEGHWDLFIQVFTEAHCAGHQCWHLHDPEHPAHDAKLAADLGDPLRAVYRAIDTAIGRIVERAGDARVLLLSLHGMAHAFGAQFMLRDLLIGLGVTASVAPAPQAMGVATIARAGMRAIWHRLPASVRASAAPLRHRVHRGRTGATPFHLGVDAARSQCFPQGNGLMASGIRLNLVGREPGGILEPGSAAERFEEQLTRDLLDIVDDRSGRPLVRRVLRTRRLYAGERLDALPDLLVEWDDTTALGSAAIGDGAGATIRAVSNRLGALTATNEYGRTGEHRSEGLFIATGPNTPHMRLAESVSIQDFAPTFARLFDFAHPEFDGMAIPALIEAWR